MTDNQHIYLNAMAYIANRSPNHTIDFHKLSKILYFAEQKHLAKYGRKLVEDTFVAMENGPVPSAIYDILKRLRFAPADALAEFRNAFTTQGWKLTAVMEPDMDWLSESEVNCINESLEENLNLDFHQLSEKSHDKAWTEDLHMNTIKIARIGGANEDMIAYIKSQSESHSYSTDGNW